MLFPDIGFGLFSGLIYILQPSLLHYPLPKPVEPPAAWHLDDEEVT